MSERSVITVAVILVLIMAVFLMFWGAGFGMMGPGMMGWQWYGGFWWMPLMMIVFWVLVGLGIYLLIRAYTPSRRRPYEGGEQDRALAIARERLARGEITLEEFEKIKKSLSE